MAKYHFKGEFELESGKHLVDPVVEYKTYGTLNGDASNVVWVCHALTANADVFEWWPGLFGREDHFNEKEHFVICANVLGSHYGTTGPLSVNPIDGVRYFHGFPNITIRDMVKMHIHLAQYLGIEKIDLLIGGSVGGHQALEWSIMEPKRIINLCLLASSARISPWASALNASQRMAIENDPSWSSNVKEAGLEGMAVARSIALLSYRNQATYNDTQEENLTNKIYQEKAESYQRYQGKKLVQRFNAFSYWHLSKSMDSHNVSRNRQSLNDVLALVEARTLILTMDNDLLFPLEDQLVLKDGIRNAEHQIIPTPYGHDGFLLEVEKISKALKMFYSKSLA